MIQRNNPTLPCADAGPISAAFSANPMPHHACGGKIGHQLKSHAGKTARPVPNIFKIPLAPRINRCGRNAQSP